MSVLCHNIILFPFRTTVAPEWRIVAVYAGGNAIPALTVSQYWQDYLVADSESRTTNGQGVVIFPERTVEANLLERIYKRASSLINVHGRSGQLSFLTATAPNSLSGHAEYSPGKPLPSQMIVR